MKVQFSGANRVARPWVLNRRWHFLISLMPGFGQLVNRDFLKALIIALITLGGIVNQYWNILTPPEVFLWIFTWRSRWIIIVLVWLYAIRDAYLVFSGRRLLGDWFLSRN